MAGSKTIEIYLYLLERTETAYTGEWRSCIVAAPTESQARQLANEEAGAEGVGPLPYIWTDGSLTTSKKIGIAEDGVQGVIMFAVE